MVASVFSGLPQGLDARVVDVQVDVSHGSVMFSLVGLAAASVKEARERVRSAIKNSGLVFPSAHRLTVNLAPAELRKEGSSLDLAIAVGIVAAQAGKALPATSAFVGELALDGSVGHVNGVLVLVRALRRRGFTDVFVPEVDAAEAALVDGVNIHRCPSLREVAAHVLGESELQIQQPARLTPPENVAGGDDLADVQGQEAARRALEIAAAGGHHLLLSGSPGAGKTMLARCLPGLLPPLSFGEALQVAQVRSVLGELGDVPLQWERPFRSPHHSVSCAGLIGGGSLIARPGEVSRAHLGVLFLDELAEFSANALQALRQPLEDRRVTLTRSGGSVSYPADFQLVAATNPCPCGWAGDEMHRCRCTDAARASYAKTLSGPLLDRIDLRVNVTRPRLELLTSGRPGEASEAVRERVRAARRRQLERQGRLNSALRPAELRSHAGLPAAVRDTLQRWGTQAGLSARALHRACRVALTLADLEDRPAASSEQALEALGYRLSDEVA